MSKTRLDWAEDLLETRVSLVIDAADVSRARHFSPLTNLLNAQASKSDSSISDKLYFLASLMLDIELSQKKEST